MEVRPNENEYVLSLLDRVYVRENLSSKDPVKIPYYSSEKFAVVCNNCACTENDRREGQYPLVTIVEGKERSLSSRKGERSFQNSKKIS